MINRDNWRVFVAALIASLIMWWLPYEVSHYLWFHFQKAVVIELAEEIKREGM